MGDQLFSSRTIKNKKKFWLATTDLNNLNSGPPLVIAAWLFSDFFFLICTRFLFKQSPQLFGHERILSFKSRRLEGNGLDVQPKSYGA